VRNSARRKVRLSLAYVSAIAVIVALLLPLLWVVTTSLRPISEVTSTPPTLMPKSPTFDAYVSLWREAPFGKYFANSMVVSISTALIALAFSAGAAYSFARFRFRGSTALLILVVMSQMLPGSSILIPLFQVIRGLNLLDTRSGLILTYTGFAIPFCTWLLFGYFRAIPTELEEAALIDGCSRLQVLYRIVLPLAAPAVVAVGAFAFLLSWNEFLFAFVLGRDDAITLPVGLRAAFLGQYVNKYDQLFAASLIFSIPPVALFVALQRHFVQGLTSGAVKG
jgi:multiple sugar transport system permease protein